METLRIEIKDKNVLSILRGLEKAGLIAIPKGKSTPRKLSRQLRASISAEKAANMVLTIDKDREEWENRY
jgi:hypothetical protein